MGKGIIIAALLTILAPLCFLFSHRLHDIELFIGFVIIRGTMPVTFSALFPLLLVPHLLSPKFSILFAVSTFVATGIFSHQVSLREWALKDHEGVRIAIILSITIFINLSIAIFAHSEEAQAKYDDRPQEKREVSSGDSAATRGYPHHENEVAGDGTSKWRIKIFAFAIVVILILVLFPVRQIYYKFFDPYDLYYRLTVDLTDKQGRPVGIDIVVGCGVHRGHIIGGGYSFDVMAMDAAHYAWAIPDGHALSVRTSPGIASGDTCSGGTTDNGRIPRDWLPFVIWYDNEADLSHGLAYATQDAYASPRARLVFRGARVARATAAEYRAFKARVPANLLPRYLADALLDSARPERLGNAAQVTPEMVVDPKRAWRNSNWLTCMGLIRVPLPAAVRADIAKLRPANAPKYWSIPGQLPRTITSKIPSIDETYGGGFMRPDTPEWNEKRPKVYPQSFDGNLDSLSPATFADGSYHRQTTIVPENLGFMACGRRAPEPLEAAVTGRRVMLADRNKNTCFLDGVRTSNIGWCQHFLVAFEETSYVYQKTHELNE